MNKLILLKLFGIIKFIIGVPLLWYGLMNIMTISTKYGMEIFFYSLTGTAFTIIYSVYLGFSGYFDFKKILDTRNIILRIGVFLSLILTVLLVLSYFVGSIENFIIVRAISIAFTVLLLVNEIYRTKLFPKLRK